jgi:hypothetical protein
VSDVERVQKIYSLLDLSPADTYNEIFALRGINIRSKLSIIAGCLNDQKELDNNKRDPKNRQRSIKKAGQSLQELVAKNRIRDGEVRSV